MDWPVTFVQVAIWVACAVVVIVAFVKAWPWFRKAFKLVDALTGLAEFIPETKATLESQGEQLDQIKGTLTAQTAKLLEIHHETHENNGSSIKDSVHRVENSLDRVERGVKGLYDRMDAAELEIERTRPPMSTRRRKPPTKKENPS